MSKIKGMDKAQKRWRDMAKKFPGITKQAMHDATIMILTRAHDNVTHAGPFLLNVKTGALRSAIHPTVKQKGGDYTVGTVGIGPHVPYGKTHEYGFTGNQRVRAHTRKGSQVKAHTRYMRLKKRPWLSLAYKIRKPRIRKRFELITQELLKAAR